jgi:hypothetical protein
VVSAVGSGKGSGGAGLAAGAGSFLGRYNGPLVPQAASGNVISNTGNVASSIFSKMRELGFISIG